MPFTEFCCRSGGSNMNGGSIAANTEPSTTPGYSSTNGGWNSTTGVYTPTSGNPSTSVNVGDFASVFPDGSTTPVFIGRVTAVNSTTVTISISAKAGTAPTTAGTGVSINVGGAWLGPNGANIFPFNFVGPSLTNSTGNMPRYNFKNNQTYSVTASCAHAVAASGTFQGYGTTFGDLGKANIDAGGTAIIILNCSQNNNHFLDFIFSNNGATNVDGFVHSGSRSLLSRLVAHDIGGMGLNVGSMLDQSEAYACNVSNTVNKSAIQGSVLISCISHDNPGSNVCGFSSNGGGIIANCIADTNGLHGILLAGNNSQYSAIGNDCYNNGGSGIVVTPGSSGVIVRNNNLIKNGQFGIDPAGGLGGNTQSYVLVQNNGFGSGSQANTSGQIGTAASNGVLVVTGSVIYASGVTPWVDPANGDFRISLGAAKNAGYGQFTETQAGYAGTIGYPDIGAAQHLDTPGTGGGNHVIGS